MTSEKEIDAAAGRCLDENDIVKYPGIPLSRSSSVFDMKAQSKSKYFEEKIMGFFFL